MKSRAGFRRGENCGGHEYGMGSTIMTAIFEQPPPKKVNEKLDNTNKYQNEKKYNQSDNRTMMNITSGQWWQLFLEGNPPQTSKYKRNKIKIDETNWNKKSPLIALRAGEDVQSDPLQGPSRSALGRRTAICAMGNGEVLSWILTICGDEVFCFDCGSGFELWGGECIQNCCWGQEEPKTRTRALVLYKTQDVARKSCQEFCRDAKMPTNWKIKLQAVNCWLKPSSALFYSCDICSAKKYLHSSNMILSVPSQSIFWLG